ncbi:hypothetical protein TNCV_2023671 [Trichonephila clavipes]|nr:hypothetical protein TNCV_2023671 [Trichonephila clavipes]
MRAPYAEVALQSGERAGRRAVLLARWIVRSVPLEIVGHGRNSSGHEKIPTYGKPGLERPGRPQGEKFEGSHIKIMYDPSYFANPTPLAHADTSRDVLPRGGTSHIGNCVYSGAKPDK